ncbi:ABC transporter ATP-binding protein [Exiguobacterium flavidum]|uniref:ABC transporter ATP-binding protein n=1 Tax=Exiguobacterium flavidum TaxID=2184695 RepID=UPI000DF823BA|nr:ABC transporter ATP-binding protein [Exiguobacterium flavidum]
MIELTDITKRYGETEILSGISLTAKAGEMTALVGPSGSGKSTLLQVIGLLQRQTSGSFRIDGRDTGDLSEEERRKLRLASIGFIFQEAHLVPFLTAKEQLMLVEREHGVRESRAERLLEQFGLAGRADHLPATLSGGQRQRVAIARALVNEPRLILADEPTASLDYANGRSVMEMLRSEADTGKNVLLITHDERMLDLCDSVFRLEDGRLRK